MITFPNCKINLGLRIVRKRTDGYHDLETIFYPVNITDALEIVRADITSFTATGLPISGPDADNLCLKAYHLLKKDFTDLPAMSIHLHKVIPMGAGLGGGSADGAFMLRLLNDKFRLSLTTDQLEHYALQLGSDCPFFIQNRPVYATGRGEQLSAVTLDLSGYGIVVINPGIHVSTKDAFARLTPHTPKKSLAQIITQPIATWKTDMLNDFEAPVFSLHPELALIKDLCYGQGAVYAAMSGSGSSIFGIFPQSITPTFNFPNHYNVFSSTL